MDGLGSGGRKGRAGLVGFRNVGMMAEGGGSGGSEMAMLEGDERMLDRCVGRKKGAVEERDGSSGRK